MRGSRWRRAVEARLPGGRAWQCAAVFLLSCGGGGGGEGDIPAQDSEPAEMPDAFVDAPIQRFDGQAGPSRPSGPELLDVYREYLLFQQALWSIACECDFALVGFATERQCREVMMPPGDPGDCQAFEFARFSDTLLLSTICFNIATAEAIACLANSCSELETCLGALDETVAECPNPFVQVRLASLAEACLL